MENFITYLGCRTVRRRSQLAQDGHLLTGKLFENIVERLLRQVGVVLKIADLLRNLGPSRRDQVIEGARCYFLLRRVEFLHHSVQVRLNYFFGSGICVRWVQRCSKHFRKEGMCVILKRFAP